MLAMIGRIMIVSTTIAVKYVGRVGSRRAEERDEAERRVERRIDVVVQERREHEDPPEPDHDAGDRGERLDERGDRAADPARRELAEEERDAERDRGGEDQRAERGDRSAEEEAARAELEVDRVPGDGP